MKAEKELKQIKGFFIIVVSITAACVSIVSYCTYQDLQSLRKEYASRLEIQDSRVKEIYTRAQQAVADIEKRGEKEIELLKTTVLEVAKKEAYKQIEVAYKYGSIEKKIEEAARNTFDDELERLIAIKLKESDEKLDKLFNDMTELSLHLVNLNDNHTEGYFALIKIRNQSPNSQKGRLADRIIWKKLDLLEKNYKNESDNLDELIRKTVGCRNGYKKAENVKLELAKIINSTNSIYDLFRSVVALQLLGYSDLKLDDIDRFKEILEELQNPV